MSFNFTAVGALGAGTGNLMRFGLFSSNNDAASYMTSHRSTASLKYDGYAVAIHNTPYTESSQATVRADLMVRDHLKGVTSSTGVNTGQVLTNTGAFYEPAKAAVANYPSSDPPLQNPAAPGNPYSTDTHTFGSLALSTLYTGQLTLTRVNETTMLVSSSITGGGLSILDEYLHIGEAHDYANQANLKVGRSIFTFDTIAFAYNWAGNAGMQEMLIDNILVTHTVPEPGRAMLLGMAALVGFARRQRRGK